MGIVKKLVRKIALPSMVALGIDKVVLALKRKKCLVVNFHGVRSESQKPINNRHLNVIEFEKTIAYFAKNFKVVPLSELMEIRRSGHSPKEKTIALTFDDGYLNNFEIALPILKKYNTPATFYIITRCLLEDDFLAWPDGLDLFYQLKSQQTVEINTQTFQAPHYVNLKSNIALVDYLKTLGADTVKQVDLLLNGKIEKEPLRLRLSQLLQLITAEKLKKYANEPLLEIGSHSHSHFCMEYINDIVANDEFATSKKVIEECIGKPIYSFAFPDGSYTKRSLELCKEAGFTSICAVTYKNADDSNDKDLIARFSISNSSTHESNILRLAHEFDRYGY